MQLSHAKKLAKAAAGETVVDTVVTVPAFFNHNERRAMLDAIELAGLKPLALIDDGSAGELTGQRSRIALLTLSESRNQLRNDENISIRGS